MDTKRSSRLSVTASVVGLAAGMVVAAGQVFAEIVASSTAVVDWPSFRITAGPNANAEVPRSASWAFATYNGSNAQPPYQDVAPVDTVVLKTIGDTSVGRAQTTAAQLNSFASVSLAAHPDSGLATGEAQRIAYVNVDANETVQFTMNYRLTVRLRTEPLSRAWGYAAINMFASGVLPDGLFPETYRNIPGTPDPVRRRTLTDEKSNGAGVDLSDPTGGAPWATLTFSYTNSTNATVRTAFYFVAESQATADSAIPSPSGVVLAAAGVAIACRRRRELE